MSVKANITEYGALLDELDTLRERVQELEERNKEQAKLYVLYSNKIAELMTQLSRYEQGVRAGVIVNRINNKKENV